MPKVKPRTVLYRNADQEFERLLAKPSAERKLAVDMVLAENDFGFSLELTDEDNNWVTVCFEQEKVPARTPQLENLRTQLGKLGNTPFELRGIEIHTSADWFIPSSVLADWRRVAVEKLQAARRICFQRQLSVRKETNHAFPQKELTYLGNVMNTQSVAFYREHGVQSIKPAFELEKPQGEQVVMFCKYCIRYRMGWCPTHQKKRSPYKEPYYLEASDGRRFRLKFDCKQCMMQVLKEDA